MLEQLHPHNPVHSVACGLRFRKPFDQRSLDATLQEVVQRYDILRSEFQVQNGTPILSVKPTARVTVNVVDLRELAVEKREQELLRLSQQKAQQPLDLHGALMRATVFALSEREHVFLLVAHRIVCDELSLRNVLSEVYSRYEAARNGKSQAADSALQYSEIAADLAAPSPSDVAYWQQRLEGAPSSIDLPTDRGRPATQSFRGAKQTISIEESLVDQICSLGNSQGTDLFTTLLTAFFVLLLRYSRQDDLVVGTRVSGRNRPGLSNAIGLFENLLALRVDAGGEPSFADFVIRVRDVVNDAFSRQDVPFETLVKQLHPERDMSRHPIFQVLFTSRHADGAFLDDSSAAFFELENPTEQFDLAVELAAKEQRLEVTFSYSSDLFEGSTIGRMMEHFRILLQSAVADPSLPITRLPWFGAAERNQVLVEFNNTGFPYRRDLPLHHFFESQVEDTPEATAVVFGSNRITYRELNGRANQLAHRLKKNGVGPDVLVGVCAERCLELIIALLGILKAGGAYVPLDPEYPGDRLAAILEDSKVPILLATEKSARVLPPHRARVIRLDADWDDIATEPANNPTSELTSGHLAYVLFTSGSTGRPKGVALEHRSASIFVQWARDVFSPEELSGTLFATSVCFDLSVFEMFVPLSTGGKVIIAQNALELPRLAAAREVTLINTVPSAIAELVRAEAVPPSVRVINLAGEALLTSLAQQIYDKTGVRKIYNLYGPTEDTTYSTYTLVPRGGEVTIGRPLPHTQAYVLDDNQEAVPVGVPGELYLAGDGLARGYFGQENLTRERFVPNPFSTNPGSRMYRTGDLARYLPDSNLEYMGRLDNQVKLRGFRIELEEIESVLSRHASVQSAVVMAREIIPGDKRLVAYVVPSGQSFSAPALKEAARQTLPAYMVPSVFVEMKALPLSPNGKIDRRRLPLPEPAIYEGSDVVKPRDELESTLVRVWEKALGVPAIGIRDDFFDLGGHSLIAARVLAEVGHAIGRDLPLSALFRGATVESLAQFIRQGDDFRDAVVIEIQHGDQSRLPFFAIVPPGEESLGYAMLARHMGPAQTVYKIQGHAPVLDGTRPHTREELKNLTDEYVAAIRSVQPHGPYCLGGLCDGTHIAEQIVLSLEAQGEEVGLFAIFDTWVMQHSQIPWLWKFHYYGQRFQEMKKMKLRERLASYKHAAETRVAMATGQKPGRTDWQERYWPQNFTPQQFRAPVVLFKRPKQQFYYVKDREMGWGKRSESGVEIHEIDFHHLHILREPHVGQFGAVLAQWITRISRRSSQLQNSTEHESLTSFGRQVQQGS